jgi:hypothetical protein
MAEMNETEFKSIAKEWIEKTYDERAWILNQIIECMNNEEAYYGEWLETWPDGESLEDCAYDFGNKKSYEKLKIAFKETYTAYHDDGLYKPNFVARKFAPMWDYAFGLKPIEIF